MMHAQHQYQSGGLIQKKQPSLQKLLDDNSQLISLILDLQSKGKQIECLEYQRELYRNLSYLTQFDPSPPNHPNTLPSPDTFVQTRQSMANENMVQHVNTDQGNYINQVANLEYDMIDLYYRKTRLSVIMKRLYRTQSNTPSQTSSHVNTSQYSLPTSTNPSGEQQHSSVSSHSNPMNKFTTSQQRAPYLQHGQVPNSNSMDPSYSQSYVPQQNNYQIQQQWYNQSRMPIQQEKQYTSSYQQ
ncbi:unnamed protein product [Rotaria socialis]|uniref:SS18 N-terminal domain-containing protein n=1 Tax=Rotaria socialis TaxID=392032 RepID=A0A820WUS5_9BILA|nr:unnamed protein product [Rotaria socialis]